MEECTTSETKKTKQKRQNKNRADELGFCRPFGCERVFQGILLCMRDTGRFNARATHWALVGTGTLLLNSRQVLNLAEHNDELKKENAGLKKTMS